MSVIVDDPLFNAKLLMSFGPPKHSAEDITTVQTYIKNNGLFKTVNDDIINLILTMNSNPTAGGYTNDLFQLIKNGEDPNSEKFKLAVQNFKTLETILPKSNFDVTNAPELNLNEIMDTVLPILNLTESEMNNIKNVVQGRPASPLPSTSSPASTSSPRTRTPDQAYMGTKASNAKQNAKILPPKILPPKILPQNAKILPPTATTTNALPPTTTNALPPTTPNAQRGGFIDPVSIFVLLGAMNATCKITGMKNSVCSVVSNGFNGILNFTGSVLGCVGGAFFRGGRKKSRRRQNKSKRRRQNKSKRRRQQ